MSILEIPCQNQFYTSRINFGLSRSETKYTLNPLRLTWWCWFGTLQCVHP